MSYATLDYSVADGILTLTLDRETGIVRYIYGPHSHVPPAQWSIEFKPGASMGQITAPEKK